MHHQLRLSWNGPNPDAGDTVIVRAGIYGGPGLVLSQTPGTTPSGKVGFRAWFPYKKRRHPALKASSSTNQIPMQGQHPAAPFFSGKWKAERVWSIAPLHVDFVAKVKIVAGEFLSNLVEQIVL